MLNTSYISSTYKTTDEELVTAMTWFTNHQSDLWNRDGEDCQ